MSVTFCIPVKIDTPDRERNLTYLLTHLKNNNYTNIIVCEIDSDSKLDNLKKNFVFEHMFIQIAPGECNHKCRTINKMLAAAKTEKVCIQDVDCLIPVSQIEQSIVALDTSDFVFPYDGRFYNVPVQVITPGIYSTLNEEFTKHCGLYHPQSVGGAIMFNKTYLKSIGNYNENFKSWGFEDNEIVVRAVKLGARGVRVKGPIFHLDHARGADSSPQNNFYKQNEAEYHRINNTPSVMLREEIRKWSWVN
jgi:predicted glycosyltransferase involved in capsule biosynthesis